MKLKSISLCKKTPLLIFAWNYGNVRNSRGRVLFNYARCGGRSLRKPTIAMCDTLHTAVGPKSNGR